MLRKSSNALPAGAIAPSRLFMARHFSVYTTVEQTKGGEGHLESDLSWVGLVLFGSAVCPRRGELCNHGMDKWHALGTARSFSTTI